MPRITLVLDQILNLAFCPGITTIKLDGKANTKQRHGVEITLEEGSPSPYPGYKQPGKTSSKFSSLKTLVLYNVDFDFPSFLITMGPLPALEVLDIELAPPCPIKYPSSGIPDVPYWYSHGVAEAVEGVVGKHSSVRHLRLVGFNCYKTQSNECDYLAQLLNPEYLPNISEVFVSGFTPPAPGKSAFWPKFQVEGSGNQAGMLPIKNLTFIMKHFRDDVAFPVDYEDINTALEIGRVLHEHAARNIAFTRHFRIDISFDPKYHAAKFEEGNLGRNYGGISFAVVFLPGLNGHPRSWGTPLWCYHKKPGYLPPLVDGEGWEKIRG